MKTMQLCLANGNTYQGISFGADAECLGEVVFTTGMTGYLEVLTDPSYYGQIVTFTFPLIGNYGVQDFKKFAEEVDEVYESKKIWVKGVVLAEVSEEFSHYLATSSFSAWLKSNNVPALHTVDTRSLTQDLRESGVIMGSLSEQPLADYTDPLAGRYVPEVSPKKIQIIEPDNPIGKTIAFVDCGAKNGIFRNFLRRGVRVIRLPFDQDPFAIEEKFDGIFLSNGPGDPAVMHEVIASTKKAIASNVPVFGICLGNQMIGLAAGAQTVKMKYGHRGVNQPVQDIHTKRCLITTQNHGYIVDEATLPNDYEAWFINLNDQTNEGIRHKTQPIFAVQFHPEACAGPEDAEYLFDAFIEKL